MSIYYIFSESGDYIASCDTQPNLSDLATRGETCHHSHILFTHPVLVGGEIMEKASHPLELKQIRQQLIDDIDNTASSITERWTRFIDEYEEREKAAKAFTETNYEGEPGIWITAFSQAAGLANKTATQLILKQAEQLRTLQAQLGALRMRKYELKQADLTLEQLQEKHDEIVQAMQELAEAQQ